MKKTWLAAIACFVVAAGCGGGAGAPDATGVGGADGGAGRGGAAGGIGRGGGGGAAGTGGTAGVTGGAGGTGGAAGAGGTGAAGGTGGAAGTGAAGGTGGASGAGGTGGAAGTGGVAGGTGGAAGTGGVAGGTSGAAGTGGVAGGTGGAAGTGGVAGGTGGAAGAGGAGGAAGNDGGAPDGATDGAAGCTNDGACGDGKACNGVETCDLATNTCRPGTPLVCNDGNACTTDSCDDAVGCRTALIDADGEGFAASSLGACGTDCNDSNAAIYPGATEIVGDEVDQNCDGVELCYVDQDADGYRLPVSATLTVGDIDCRDAGEARASIPATDCNDTDAAINPGATETPGDGVDRNCDGAELCYVDQDGDGYRLSSTVMSVDADCLDAGEAMATAGADCNDASAAVNPGAAEIAGDEVDQNCDGIELCYADLDGDGYRVTSTMMSADADCRDAGEALASLPSGDCNDALPGVNPGAAELCANGVDENCNAMADELPECSINCNWTGAQFLSHGYDGAAYSTTGAWFSCTGGKLSYVQFVVSGALAVSPPASGTSDLLVGCNWTGNRWASQGVDGGGAFTYGADVACNGTRVTALNWGLNQLPAMAGTAGDLGCNWTGARFISHGIDGGCAFQTGFAITCNANRITHFQWLQPTTGCAPQR